VEIGIVWGKRMVRMRVMNGKWREKPKWGLVFEG
jgi:hypothetical protein